MELRNKYDTEISFDDLAEAKSYFLPKEEIPCDPEEFLGENYESFCTAFKAYKTEIKAASNLEELADVLNRYSDEFGNGSEYYTMRLEDEPNRKYELTDIRQSVSISGESLYRIKALKEFVNEATGVVIEKGQLGGFVQSENNLSHSGTCWVDESARVFNNARVTDDAYIGGESMANKNTVIKDSAIVTGAAWITQSAKISGNAYIRDMAFIKGEAEIGGTAEVTGHHTIGGNTVLTSGIHNGTAAPAQITMQSQSLEM